MRVHRNFAFIDLSGFTSFTELNGDEEAVWVLGLFRWHVREVATRRGVRVAKWLGDGAMLVCVEDTPLVEAVIELERRVDQGESPLVLRAGMAGGDVILMEGDDYIGTPVNLAARFLAAAHAHEILATLELAAVAPPWVEVEPIDPLALRGFALPMEAVNLRWPANPGQTVIDPVCGLEIGADAVVVNRPAGDGEAKDVVFCSVSCADAWDSSRAREASP